MSPGFKGAFYKDGFFLSLWKLNQAFQELIGYPWHKPHWKPSNPEGKVSPAAQAILRQARIYALIAVETPQPSPAEKSSATYRQKLAVQEINFIFGRQCDEIEMHTLRAIAVAGSWYRFTTKLRELDSFSAGPRDLQHYSRKTLGKCSGLLRQRVHLWYTRLDAERLELLNLLHFCDDAFWSRRDETLPPPRVDSRGYAWL
jgi:hypothetical protein